MGNIGADTGNDSATPEPLPSERAETSSDPAALPAVEEAIESEINESARVAADAPIPAPAIPFDSLAGIFPPSEASIRELAQRIGGNVPIDPVILFGGKILDRADLYLACLMVGREPRFETFAGDDPFEFVVGRHLNSGPLSESLRAMAGARAANLHLGDNQHSQGVPIGRASELLNVSSRSIARARFVLRFGTPDLIAAVDSGSITVSAAHTECHRLCKQAFRNGNAPATVTPITQEAGSTAQAETLPGGETEGSTSSTISIPQAAESDVPSIAEMRDGAETTAEPVEAAEATIVPTTWVWSEHIPCAAVTAITGNSSMVSIVAIRLAATVAVGRQFPDYEKVHRGEVVWVSNQSERTLFGALDLACGSERPMPIEVLEPELDHCGLPIRNLSADLWRLNHKLSAATQVTVIDYISEYLAHGDLERNIARLGSALRALQAFAVEHGTAVLLPMQLPCRRQTDFTAAVQILAKSTEIKSVLIVERDMASETGTLRKLQGRGDQHACEHRFHVRQKWGSSEAKVRVIEWDSLAAFQDELSRRW